MAYFDNHIHLARLPRPLELARELHERGYKYRAVACEPWEWRALDKIWEKAENEGWVEGCSRSYGIHPMIAEKISEETAAGDPTEFWAELHQLLENDPEALVGEAGLDKRYPGYEPGGVQEELFRKQAKMSLELGRDLQIHCVGDYGRVIAVLREAGYNGKGAHPIFHRFGGDSGIVKAGLSLGALYSIHADSCRKKSTRESLALIPAENLRIETDADETFVQDVGVSPKEVAERLILELPKAL